mmetsp:Transcript_3463/g.5200  ORF Transcript_3463/g.5200 Transcript_3463/m.5200 type:complete len:95 (+) Transcript_3463:302-586(+)
MMPSNYIIKPKKKLIREAAPMTSSIRKNSIPIQHKEVNQTEESESFYFDEPETMPPLKASRNSKFFNNSKGSKGSKGSKEEGKALPKEDGAEVK